MQAINYAIVTDDGEVERNLSHVAALRRSEHLTKTTRKLHSIKPLSERVITSS